MSVPGLSVELIVVGPLLTNCYIVWDGGSNEGIIIDPGEDPHIIIAKVKELGVCVDRIIATHCHFDHIAAVAGLKREMDLEFIAHEGDLFFVEDAKASARRWGFEIEQPPLPDSFVKDGDVIRIGGHSLKVMHTPGHSPGGVSFYRDGMVFAGDCLFLGSIGRTDFRMGSFEELERSIKTRLYTLPENTLVYTGHGPVTTIGDERRTNPFVRG